MRFLLLTILSVAAAYVIGLYLIVPANPEVKFWREVIGRREREIASVRKNQPDTPIIFFTGGSSTAFSIDPEIIEKACGLPSFNLGLPVAAGAEYLLHQALEQTLAGDILVFCIEPDILATTAPEPSPSKFSFAMAAVSGRVTDAAGGATFDATPSLPEYLSLSRPGAGYLATFMAKSATGKGYRYNIADIRYRGRIETPIRKAKPAAARGSSRLSPYGRNLLTRANSAARARGVILLYAMPWHFTATSGVDSSRLAQARLNQDIQKIIPTVDDGFAGVADNPAWFSDSPQHLTAEGSKLRSQVLAAALHKHFQEY